jgi:hypothetical protein
MNMLIRRFCTPLLLCLLLLTPPRGNAIGAPQAFHPGERLVYELKWTVIPAGFGTLEVLPMTRVAGEPAQHFRITARTNSFVDNFYKVRDEIDAYTDADVTRSLLYRKKQQEGRHRRHEIVTFDWQNRRACYSNFGKEKEPVDILPGAFDPMSVLYFVRTQPIRIGDILKRPVTDGKKCIIGTAKVVGRETIEVPAGSFDTWLLEPALEHVGGVFKKSPEARMRIWITADERKLLVKLSSKVIVGHFTAELMPEEENPDALF